MPKRTLQQRLVDALVASGRGTPVASGSRKYVTLKRPDGDFYFVGKAGALRFGKTVTGSVAAPDDFKRRLLDELGIPFTDLSGLVRPGSADDLVIWRRSDSDRLLGKPVEKQSAGL